MQESDEEKRLKISQLRVEGYIKISRLILAIMVLLNVLVLILTGWIGFNNKSIFALLNEKEKPFQGIWLYESKYKEWHDEDKPEELMGDGKTIIIWKTNEKRYDVYTMFKISRSGKDTPSLLSLSLKGILNADSLSGFPKTNVFSMHNFNIIARVAYRQGLGAPTQSYELPIAPTRM